MIDTRSKIVAPQQAAEIARSGTPVLIAFFDPLLPAHVEHLRARMNGVKPMVVLATPDDAYLEAQARAELAASLEFVSAVVIADSDPMAFAATLGAPGILPAHTAEAGLRQQFIQRVRDKARA